ALVVMGLGSALFVALTGVVGFAALPAATVLTLFFFIRGLFGLFTAPIYPASSRTYAHWIPSNQRAAVNGMTTGAAVLGVACTYYGFGQLLDWLNWPAAFVVTGIVTALLALLWTWYGRSDPSQHPRVNAAELHQIRSAEK